MRRALEPGWESTSNYDFHKYISESICCARTQKRLALAPVAP
ncbi:18218_t:CDS:2, partial [Rhizophagus irregularis]